MSAQRVLLAVVVVLGYECLAGVEEVAGGGFPASAVRFTTGLLLPFGASGDDER